MVKLTQMRPLIGRLPPRLGPAPGDEKDRNKYRSQSEPWRKLYQCAAWKRLRLSIFKRDLFTCQLCRKLEGNTSKLVCDHVKPHKGNEVLFWDQSNLQCLCKSCHDGLKQKEERGNLSGL